MNTLCLCAIIHLEKNYTKLMAAIQPILETNRLHFRQLMQSDADALFSYLSKDEVMTYYDLATFSKKEEAENLIDLWNTRFVNKEGIRWAITFKEDVSMMIGTCGFHNISKEHNRAEIGYEIHPNYWGKGIATEATLKLIEYGFQELAYHRIEAYIHPQHDASRKVLHKAGMQTEGILKDYFFEKGKFVDAEILSIINFRLPRTSIYRRVGS